MQITDGSVKPIEAVKLGDLVKSRDPQTGQDAAEPVLQTLAHVDPRVLA